MGRCDEQPSFHPFRTAPTQRFAPNSLTSISGLDYGVGTVALAGCDIPLSTPELLIAVTAYVYVAPAVTL